MQLPKLIHTFKAVQLLRRKFKTVAILAADNPKQAWKSEPLFTVHKLDRFGTESSEVEAEEVNTKRKLSTHFSLCCFFYDTFKSGLSQNDSFL